MQVIIRPWEFADSSALAAIANNRNIWNCVRDRLPHPYHEQDALEFITKAKSREPAENLCVEADGRTAGSIGVILYDDIYRGNIEIGYFIDEALWGKGVATEAVKLLISYIYSHHQPVRIIAKVKAQNQSSMRVLEKNGFHLEAIHKKGIIKNNLVYDEYVWVMFNAAGDIP